MVAEWLRTASAPEPVECSPVSHSRSRASVARRRVWLGWRPGWVSGFYSDENTYLDPPKRIAKHVKQY